MGGRQGGTALREEQEGKSHSGMMTELQLHGTLQVDKDDKSIIRGEKTYLRTTTQVALETLCSSDGVLQL